MAALRICSWNVNGLRAGLRSGTFPAWLEASAPDIAGLQEVKARPEQVEERPWLGLGYEETWHSAEEPGYSGALLLAKRAPASLRLGLETPEFAREGRVIEADFGEFVLLTSYFPNAGRKLARLDFKLAYYEAFLARIKALREAGRSVVFMGDLNVAHAAIDVARPNEKETGFLPVEREWVDRVIASGFTDTFRALHPDQGRGLQLLGSVAAAARAQHRLAHRLRVRERRPRAAGARRLHRARRARLRPLPRGHRARRLAGGASASPRPAR